MSKFFAILGCCFGSLPKSLAHMNRFLLLVILLFLSAAANAQIKQTIRGRVIDKETQSPLPGANIRVLDDTLNQLGASSNSEGFFSINNVPVGKHSLKISFIGYSDRIIDVTLNSGKEIVLSIEMEESSTTIIEVEVVASQRGEVNNEMSLVSTRSFDVSETERYAGSRGDPARMASNFAGVQGADDSRNDIVVRGNSPLGVLYKMEGFDLPNPNHFSIAGSAGGPVSILNNKVLANSDFFTSAFPAEYGNSTSAVFDLKMRPGNNQKHEFSAQLGFLGTELSAEGPLSKKKGSSYLAVYRYSTLSIFKEMGISLGTDAVPRYQDISFKFHFPLKNGATLSLFGIGGKSGIDILISDQREPKADFYGEDDRDQHFRTQMGMAGVLYSKTLKGKTFFRAGLAQAHEQNEAEHFYVFRHVDALSNTFVLDSLFQILDYTFRINRTSGILHFNTKLNKNHVLKYGINANFLHFNMVDSAVSFEDTLWHNRWDNNEWGFLGQAFVQWKWKPNEKFSMSAGLHSQYFSISNSLSPVEPRLGMKYALNNKQSISFGAGLHSQLQPYYTYFYRFEKDAEHLREPHNRNMDFTKSIHTVLGYDVSFTSSTRFRAETYFQYLYHIPVENKASAFSLTNMGSGFVRFFPDTLENTGTARNYGIELTLEKFFNKSFFFLITASVFDAKYKGSDDTLRNTDFNTRYAANLLIGKEFATGKKSTLGIGTKFTIAGGRWHGYIDSAASASKNELVFRNEGYNTQQYKPYYRLDFKINFKINAKKATHEFALDLVNVLGVENILNLTFNPNNSKIPESATDAPQYSSFNYQLGFLPLFYYRIDF